MTVRRMLEGKTSEIIAIEIGCTIMDVAKLLGERRIGAIPVMDNGKLAGIISERDIMRGLAIRGGVVLADKVETLMTKSVFTCTPDASIHQLMSMMTERRIRHIPILDKDTLIGMISIGDVVKERMDEAEQEANALKEYIGSA